jgi:hypothetical protein
VSTWSTYTDFSVTDLPDLFRKYLPGTAYETWRAMQPSVWVSTAEVALSRPGALGRQSVLRDLRALHAAGLVDRNGPQGHRWIALEATPEKLTLMAERAGVAGASARQAERHQQERETFADWRAVVNDSTTDSTEPDSPHESPAPATVD